VVVSCGLRCRVRLLMIGRARTVMTAVTRTQTRPHDEPRQDSAELLAERVAAQSALCTAV
jgi:hypothetical protein